MDQGVDQGMDQKVEQQKEDKEQEQVLVPAIPEEDTHICGVVKLAE